MTASPDRCTRSGLSRWRDERGQMTALVLPMLFALVLFVAVVANVGQAVNRRIALQVLADTTAYTGGSVMATGMNHLAYWNRQLQRRYVDISNITSHFYFTWSGGCNGAALSVAKAAYYLVQSTFLAVNHEFAEVVEEKTQEVFNFNRADLFPGETGFALWHESDEFNLPATPPFAVTDELVALVNGVSEGTEANHERHDWGDETTSNDFFAPPWFDLFDAESGGPGFYTKTWSCVDECWLYIPLIGCIPGIDFDGDSMQIFGADWYELTNPLGALPHMFVAGVTAPATKALMFDDFFGPNAIPEMNAVAVSHPVGGSIEDGESTYVNRFVPVRRLMYAFGNFTGEITDPLFGLNRKVTH